MRVLAFVCPRCLADLAFRPGEVTCDLCGTRSRPSWSILAFSTLVATCALSMAVHVLLRQLMRLGFNDLTPLRIALAVAMALAGLATLRILGPLRLRLVTASGGTKDRQNRLRTGLPVGALSIGLTAAVVVIETFVVGDSMPWVASQPGLGQPGNRLRLRIIRGLGQEREAPADGPDGVVVIDTNQRGRLYTLAADALGGHVTFWRPGGWGLPPRKSDRLRILGQELVRTFDKNALRFGSSAVWGDFPFPTEGQVRFHFVESGNVRWVEVSHAVLMKGDHPLSTAYALSERIKAVPP